MIWTLRKDFLVNDEAGKINLGGKKKVRFQEARNKDSS